MTDHIQLHEGDAPAVRHVRREQTRSNGLHRRVDPKSGGYLIIDQTGAMTTIDVNTGGFCRCALFDDTIFKTNLRRRRPSRGNGACETLAASSSCRLHRHGQPEHREAVLGPSSTGDRHATASGSRMVHHLGLVEMTRKRTRESLAHILWNL